MSARQTEKTEFFKDQYSILYLLPYTEKTHLSNKKQKLSDLYLIKSIVDFSIFAIENFLVGNLNKFDAQVGENLCQIRAYKIIHLSRCILHDHHKKEQLSLFKKNLHKYKNAIEEFINYLENEIHASSHYSKYLDCIEYIRHFLESRNLFLLFEEDFIFIIMRFFLDHFSIRYDNIPIAINLNYISNELHISKYIAKKIAHKYQIVICKIGCDFLLKISKDIPHINYYKLLIRSEKFSDENRLVFPCLLTSEIILYHCLYMKIPILLIARRKNTYKQTEELIYFILKPGEKGTIQVTETALPSEDGLVIVGDAQINAHISYSQYIQAIMELTPIKVILANTAMHPQYSGKTLWELRDNPFLHSIGINKNLIETHLQRLAALREFAQKHGCSIKNQASFFLKHIFASKLIKIINKIYEEDSILVYNAFDILQRKNGSKEIPYGEKYT